MSTATNKEAAIDKGPGRVMCVGLACVDFVNVVASFPLEDSDQRGERYYWQRGGNATNNCTVLTKLSTPCDFMGVLGTKGAEAQWIAEDFERSGISTVHCVRKDVQFSLATSILSIDTGTRTIIFYPRDQPQLSFEEFDKEFKGDFSAYSWIHFELTSNVTDVCRMMESVLAWRDKCNADKTQTKSHEEQGTGSAAVEFSQLPLVSLEIEKPEMGDVEKSFHRADVVFISKDFAKSRGCSDAAEAVQKLHRLCKPWATLICAWGECGAAACFRSSHETESLCVVNSPALTNIKVVDSLGAGDSFVAGVLHTLVKRHYRPAVELAGAGTDQQKHILQDAIAFGCKVAGIKCTGFGYDNIDRLSCG